MNKFKIILTVCTVAVLVLTMGVATFASNPLIEGGEQYYKVPGDQIYSWYEFIYANETVPTPYEPYIIINNTPYILEYLPDNEYYEGVLKYIYNENVQINIEYLDLVEFLIDNNEVYYLISETQKQYFIEEVDPPVTSFVPLEYENNTILSTFSAVPTFLVNAVNSATGIFWNNGALTAIGILAIIAVAFGVCFLIVGLIQRFMGFRG